MYQEIKKLIEGNKQFRAKYFTADNTLFDELVYYGQKPKILIIACSDSRIDPAIIFNCQPGELFVVRNVANLIPPCENSNNTYHGTSAALEFAVRFLEVEQIIIFGHSQCGGIQALLESTQKVLDQKQHTFIAKWMELARPAYEKVVAEHGEISLSEKITLCEKYSLMHSLGNLYTFSWISQRVKNNKISLHAWYFDLATGFVQCYDQEKKSWNNL